MNAAEPVAAVDDADEATDGQPHKDGLTTARMHDLLNELADELGLGPVIKIRLVRLGVDRAHARGWTIRTRTEGARTGRAAMP